MKGARAHIFLQGTVCKQVVNHAFGHSASPSFKRHRSKYGTTLSTAESDHSCSHLLSQAGQEFAAPVPWGFFLGTTFPQVATVFYPRHSLLVTTWLTWLLAGHHLRGGGNQGFPAPFLAGYHVATFGGIFYLYIRHSAPPMCH